MIGDQFFAIDVASEIRNLCDAQLRGTWQMPSELVRYAVRCGAGEVSIDRGLRGFTVRWKGAPIQKPTLESLAVALDDSATPELRQQAIADLESTGAEALLWAGGVAGARLDIEWVTGGNQVRFTRRAGRPPRLGSSSQPSRSDEVVVRWRCSSVDRRRALVWLHMACRFSTAQITVDGRPVARGFSGGLYRTRLEQPVPCVIGLTLHGDEPVLWLLRDGIVAARAVLPGYPPFEAAVELGSVVSGPAGSSDLRRAVVPFVSELSERAVEMMITVAGRPGGLSGPFGQRLVALLLRSARRDLRTNEIRSLPLLSTLNEKGALLSLSQLEKTATQGGGRWYVVEPGDDGDGLLGDASDPIVASPEVRNLLCELTGFRFRQPPRHRMGWLRRLSDGARARGRWAVERLLGALGPRALPEDELSSGERRLLALLRAALSPRSVELGRGGGLRRTSHGVVLPRFDRAVVAAVGLVEKDPSWLYPLVLAMRLGPPSLGSARKDWRTTAEDHPVRSLGGGEPPCGGA